MQVNLNSILYNVNSYSGIKKNFSITSVDPSASKGPFTSVRPFYAHIRLSLPYWDVSPLCHPPPSPIRVVCAWSVPALSIT